MEPITRAVIDTNEETLEQSQATTEAIEDISKTLPWKALTKTEKAFNKWKKAIQTNFAKDSKADDIRDELDLKNLVWIYLNMHWNLIMILVQ